MELTIPIILQLIAFAITEAPVVWQELEALVATGKQLASGQVPGDEQAALAAAVARRRATQSRA